MLHIINNRKWFYIISGTAIAISIVALLIWWLKPGIDFLGGTYWEFQFKNQIEKSVIEQTLKQNIQGDITIQEQGSLAFSVRTIDISEQDHQKLVQTLKAQDATFEELRWETIGPAVGKTLRDKSFRAIAFVIIGISLYVAIAFRRASRPVQSWKYGLITVATLFHDVIIPLGVFALLGRFKNVEIDTNFVVAMLVIMGFSVHDTIVVFDRIREKLRTPNTQMAFPELVNQSLNETITRSVNTSLTVLLAILAIYVWGSHTLQWFIMALMIGISTGMYSSIFIASTLLVDVWKWQQRRNN